MLVQSSKGLQALLLSLAMLIVLSIATPNQASAAKPEVTGQDKASTVGKAKVENQSKDVTDEESDDEDSSRKDRRDKSKDTNSKSNYGDNKTTGLYRAADSAKREEIRAKLMKMRELISLLQSRLDEMRGIGSRVRDFKPKNYDDWRDNDDPEPTDSTLTVVATAIEAGLVDDDDLETVDPGEFTFTLQVTASGSDYVIPAVALTDNATTTGIVFTVLNASGTEITTGNTTASLDGDTSSEVTEITVADGETYTLSVVVTHEAAEAGEYKVQLLSLNSDQASVDLTPAEEFTSELLFIGEGDEATQSEG